MQFAFAPRTAGARTRLHILQLLTEHVVLFWSITPMSARKSGNKRTPSLIVRGKGDADLQFVCLECGCTQ